MIQLNARLLLNIGRQAGLFALSAAMLPSPAAAQVANSKAAKPSLNKIVHLNLGVTTVGKLMAALSEQTGCKIQASEYLHARIVTVQMDGLTAASALDALKQLNDWTSSSSVQNQILITRRRLRVDAIPVAIPRLMQAAVPKDMRTFLQIPNPDEDIDRYRNIYGPKRGTAKRGNFDLLMRMIIADQTALITSLRPGILTGRPTPYTKLTNAQRDELLDTLLFPVIRDTDYQLLHGDLPPHAADINSAVLEMKGTATLLVGSIITVGTNESGVFFGTQIH